MISFFSKVLSAIAFVLICAGVTASSVDIFCSDPYQAYEFEIEETANLSTLKLPFEVPVSLTDDELGEKHLFWVKDVTTIAAYEGVCSSGDRVYNYSDMLLNGTLQFVNQKNRNLMKTPFVAVCRLELTEIIPENCGAISFELFE